MAKFVLTTCDACFARQKPVSTSAKPACMKITSTAPMTTQRLFKPQVGVADALDRIDVDRRVRRERGDVRDQYERGHDRGDDADPANRPFHMILLR